MERVSTCQKNYISIDLRSAQVNQNVKNDKHSITSSVFNQNTVRLFLPLNSNQIKFYSTIELLWWCIEIMGLLTVIQLNRSMDNSMTTQDVHLCENTKLFVLNVFARLSLRHAGSQGLLSCGARLSWSICFYMLTPVP